MADDGNELQEIRARLEAIEKRLGIARSAAQAGATAAAEPATARPEAARADEGVRPSSVAAAPKAAIETTIGAHWLNRIGIAAVLVGVAFFLKFAFDNNWIGPGARVLTGVAIGVALLAWAERFRARGHELFAHSIDVLGTGVLYLSIWAASQTYTLIGNGAAFGAMMVVTIAMVALALRHRSEFLAGIALTGGFLTPVLLSTGVNHEVELFAYVALLDVAALILVSLHPWVRALAVAFFGTLFLYIGWASTYYTLAQRDRTIGFATVFFLLFGVVPLMRRWGDGGFARTAVLLLPFGNAFVYFTQLSVMLLTDRKHLGWYALVLAAFNFVIAAALHLRGEERDDLSGAHLAIALGFISLAIPLRLDSLQITVGWLIEAAALLLIARRLRPAHQRVFDFLGAIALGLGVFRLLFIDHWHTYDRVLTYAIAVAIFAGIARFKRQGGLWKFAVFAMNFLAVTELTLEVADRFPRSDALARNFSWSALWMLYGAMLMVVGFQRRSSYIRWLALTLLGVTIFKVFFFDMSELERVYRILSFIGLGVLLLAISFAYQRKWLQPSE